MNEVLVNPETGSPFTLLPSEERFLRWGLTLRADGSLPFSELLYSTPKKGGKTTFAGMIMDYVVPILGGRFAEAFAVANDLEQAVSRVFRAAARIVEASPLLRESAVITKDRIEFPASGSFIKALSSDYASAAGANPTIAVFDELWAYTSERAHRLWDELVPVPTRAVSVRLVVSTAGFEGESGPLWDLYRRGLSGEVVA
jgi:hypothetical protein